METYLTLEEAILKLLRERGASGMENPRTIVGYVEDYMDPDSPELRVLMHILVANNLKPESSKRRRLEQEIAEGFVDPIARAIRDDITVDAAASLVFSHLKDVCMIREPIARQVVDGIAGGITQWHAEVEERLHHIEMGIVGMLSGSFEAGADLRTIFGRELRVVRELGRGGWGIVYEVDCAGKHMAFKWLRPEAILDRDRFVANLKRNILAGAPSPEFLWLHDMVDGFDGGVGYLMDLRPAEYEELDRIWSRPSLFESFRRIVDVCMGIASAMNNLHNAGYRYQDLKGDNVFADPRTGKVLIVGLDNVVPQGGSTGIAGTVGFMAPEIMCASRPNPTVASDMHSMAVVIFITLLQQHPLHGQRLASIPMDEEGLRYVYGTNPVFIFDEEDASNAAIQSPENNALRIWPCLPAHVQALFRRAFSREALHDPGRRPLEVEWMRELARFRSEIVACPCGHEVFLEGGTLERRCESCGRLCRAELCLEVPVGRAPDNRVPVVDDARVYRCQVQRVCNQGQELEPQVWALASTRDPRDIALRNVSGRPWEASAGGRSLEVAPGQMVRAIEGMELRVLGQTLRVRRNKEEDDR